MKLLLLSIVFPLVLFRNGDAESRRDVVGYWIMELDQGFNLVSFPVLPDNPSPRYVIGDGLGDVEITAWDAQMGRHRWARFDTETELWSGNLYLLDRGVAYWVNLLDAPEPVRLIVTGHPELYRKFRWSNLRNEWNYYAPTYGRLQSLEDLRPDNGEDLLISWNNELSRFELAEATRGRNWRSNAFDAIDPDRAYIVFLNHRVLRPIGPKTLPEYRYDLMWGEGEYSDVANPPYDEISDCETPPHPLVVGNREGLPVCLTNGDICSGGFRIEIVREGLRIGTGNELELDPQVIDHFFIPLDASENGCFRVVLTIGGVADQLLPEDRVYLVAKYNNAETRSTSFEIYDDVWIVDDLSFPEPMTVPGQPVAAPVDFSLGNPFPNPFNDRFQIEFSLPETAQVRYTLYNLRGRSVASVARPFNAGTHRLSFDGQGLSTGIYLLEVAYRQNRKIAKVAFVK